MITLLASMPTAISARLRASPTYQHICSSKAPPGQEGAQNPQTGYPWAPGSSGQGGLHFRAP